MNNYIKILLASLVITNYTANICDASQLNQQNELTNRQKNCLDKNCNKMYSILDSAMIFHNDFVGSIEFFQNISENTKFAEPLKEKLAVLGSNYNIMNTLLSMINNEGAQAHQNSIREAINIYYEILQEICTILDNINSHFGNEYNNQLEYFKDNIAMFRENIIDYFQEEVNDF